MGRLLKGVTSGETIGVDELGRWLSPVQRAALVARLSGEVEARGVALIADSRAAAGAILAEAEAQADAVRARARAEGYAAGHAEGLAAGVEQARAETERLLATVRRVADRAAVVRAALLDGVEDQAVALAIAAARRVVGVVAETHAGLAAQIVRAGLHEAGGRVLRVRVHPDDTDSVTALVQALGNEAPVYPDAVVEVGGCVIDIEGGTIDLRLDAQLDSIERVLRVA
jgi:flagellar assembly protein FliH